MFYNHHSFLAGYSGSMRMIDEDEVARLNEQPEDTMYIKLIACK